MARCLSLSLSFNSFFRLLSLCLSPPSCLTISVSVSLHVSPQVPERPALFVLCSISLNSKRSPTLMFLRKDRSSAVATSARKSALCLCPSSIFIASRAMYLGLPRSVSFRLRVSLCIRLCLCSSLAASLFLPPSAPHTARYISSSNMLHKDTLSHIL